MNSTGTRLARAWTVPASLAVLLAALASTPIVGLAQDKSGERNQTCDITVKRTGSGDNFIDVCVSNHGNVAVFATPTDHIFDEGYAVCRGIDPTYIDFNGLDSGWGAATTTDLSPVTIVRTTTDGVFTLTQKFAVDTSEKDLTITMILKNNSAVTQTSIRLMRGGDYDIQGLTGDNIFDRSSHSVFGRGGGGVPDVLTTTGMSLTATTFATGHLTAVHAQSGPNDCSDDKIATPAEGDLGGRVVYLLGNIGPGQSKTVKVTYRKL
jgi:hypothetical protein